MGFLRMISSIACVIAGLAAGWFGFMQCVFSYIPPGGYLFIGRQASVRTLDGKMDWGKLVLGILLLCVAIGAFIVAWKLWP
ncbi:MAG: hypothetical protein WC496_09195 [Phycisphaerae bacterium]|jgi:hypothetical protein